MNPVTKIIKKTFMKEVYLNELQKAKAECELMSGYYSRQLDLVDTYLSHCEKNQLTGPARDLIFEKQSILRLKSEYDLSLADVKDELAKSNLGILL